MNFKVSGRLLNTVATQSFCCSVYSILINLLWIAASWYSTWTDGSHATFQRASCQKWGIQVLGSGQLAYFHYCWLKVLKPSWIHLGCWVDTEQQALQEWCLTCVPSSPVVEYFGESTELQYWIADDYAIAHVCWRNRTYSLKRPFSKRNSSQTYFLLAFSGI